MTEPSAPYVWLGPRWYGWLEFGADHSHGALQRAADRLESEFGAVVVEALPSLADDAKEYWWMQVGQARLLLMRNVGCGVGLGAEYPDIPLLLHIGTGFGAECRGWRWPFYRLWRGLSGSGRPGE